MDLAKKVLIRVKTYHKSNLDHTKLLDHTHRPKGYFTGSMECQITEDPSLL